MTTTIFLVFGEHHACVLALAPSAEWPAAYTHADGSIEISTRLGSAEIRRPAGMDGGVVVHLTGGAIAADLCLSSEAAEMIGLALIRSKALPFHPCKDESQ